MNILKKHSTLMLDSFLSAGYSLCSWWNNRLRRLPAQEAYSQNLKL
uniref:Uncharacterized protein n=1 Tax=Rhizophora mucronata TaxID=61149 RepID=A0A2P2PP52_RHIMU